jgi:hypothetical protein
VISCARPRRPGAFELWSDEEHELVLRERFLTEESKPRVVWLPTASDGITYLKVFEVQAEYIWTESLVSALARYGVEISRDHEAELRHLLPAHAKEWIDQPRAAWRELTPGSAKLTLVDDDHILTALAKLGSSIANLIGNDRIDVFIRRIAEDFGLPSLAPDACIDANRCDDWRAAATTRLIATDAALRVPGDPPREGDRIIAPGRARDHAMKLLDRWQKNVELLATFEDLAQRGDARTSLGSWARSLDGAPALASRAAEEALFQREVEQLTQIEAFDPLVERVAEREALYGVHVRGFWGGRAEHRLPWSRLVSLARAATLLRQHAGVEKEWKTPQEAVSWFTTVGWEIDRQGEALFRDDSALPSSLHGVRLCLRRAYLRHLDRSNSAFSELLYHHGMDGLGLSFAGEVLAKQRSAKEPMAVIVLDACRYDLGARLAEMLNKGEPVRRAEVLTVRAPVPAITALGMPFALADDSGDLTVELTKDAVPRWRVTAVGGTQDLTEASGRRDWLRRQFKLKPQAITDVKSVLDAGPPSAKEAGRLLFVFGDEFDVQGHDGELQFTGAEDYVGRYARAVIQLRDAGYSSMAVVTDHGFIHWEPEKDEVDNPPTGEVLWKSRRAVVGHALKHPTAVAVSVPRSDLECRVPRSVNAFRTYGRIGFFHGGATLQELITPVVVFRWPKKAEKIAAVLTPLTEIASLKPRVEIRPGAHGKLPGFGADARMTGRDVLVRVVEPNSGRRLFRSIESVKVLLDGGAVTLTLAREDAETCPRGTRLQVEVRDADNEGIRTHGLRLPANDWEEDRARKGPCAVRRRHPGDEPDARKRCR